ncbi:MAG: DUF1489 domain-containing protein [Alphaproteobacteria bacterium]
MVDLVKLCVGAEGIADLKAYHAARWAETSPDRGAFRIFHGTRNTPKLADEILASGGSLYWVIQGAIACRQRITGFERTTRDDGQPLCLIGLENRHVPTEAWPMRPFQGWRYLKPDRRPPDAADWVGEAPPEEMARELRALGLI